MPRFRRFPLDARWNGAFAGIAISVAGPDLAIHHIHAYPEDYVK